MLFFRLFDEEISLVVKRIETELHKSHGPKEQKNMAKKENPLISKDSCAYKLLNTFVFLKCEGIYINIVVKITPLGLDQLSMNTQFT